MLLSSPKFTNFVTISDKNNWDLLYFHKKVHKKTLYLLKVIQNPPPPWLNVVSTLKKPREAVKTKNEQPICNKHWIRGEGRRVSQFLSLIVDQHLLILTVMKLLFSHLLLVLIIVVEDIKLLIHMLEFVF